MKRTVGPALDEELRLEAAAGARLDGDVGEMDGPMLGAVGERDTGEDGERDAGLTEGETKALADDLKGDGLGEMTAMLDGDELGDAPIRLGDGEMLTPTDGEGEIDGDGETEGGAGETLRLARTEGDGDGETTWALGERLADRLGAAEGDGLTDADGATDGLRDGAADVDFADEPGEAEGPMVDVLALGEGLADALDAADGLVDDACTDGEILALGPAAEALGEGDALGAADAEGDELTEADGSALADTEGLGDTDDLADGAMLVETDALGEGLGPGDTAALGADDEVNELDGELGEDAG